jgi:3-oxoacyl-[acyl-carrier protein] reductase
VPVSDFASLSGLRSVVTGSSSGIGRAIAWEFAQAGADVVLHCRESIDRAAELVRKIAGLGRRAELCVADLADARLLDEFAERAWTALGGVDVWVNNAGADVLTGAAAKLSYEQKLELLYQVDVRASVLLSRNVGGRMAESGGGVILNIGWDQAACGMEGDSGELFAATKSAVMGFTRSLSLSLAPRVRVNCIAPGWIQTRWGGEASEYWQNRVRVETPLGRWGTPDDVARAARFLASRDADFITGQVINVNGGAVR